MKDCAERSGEVMKGFVSECVDLFEKENLFAESDGEDREMDSNKERATFVIFFIFNLAGVLIILRENHK